MLVIPPIPRRTLVIASLPVLLLVGGTLGYWLIERDYTLFDALYMTVITLTTVGYEEVHKLSTAGRAFTIILLLVGVFTLAYAASELVRTVVTGELRDLLGKQLMERSLSALRDHMIVCGYGRMGRLVCHEFSKQGLPFVIIDRRQEAMDQMRLEHGIPLVGDATSDEVLRRAGVERARALVTVASSDADNLFITLSARLLNHKLFIVARAENEAAEQKLKRAGATRVVAPYVIGGYRVAQAVLRPAVVDFIELATRTEHLDLQIEETRVQAGSQLAGKTLLDCQVRQTLGVIIVAIKRHHGQMVFNPPGDAQMEPGDTLISLGRREQLDQLELLATPGSARRE
jgi:voltage-gated potassium channel